jgi:hypothetical protein
MKEYYTIIVVSIIFLVSVALVSNMQAGAQVCIDQCPDSPVSPISVISPITNTYLPLIPKGSSVGVE